MAEHSAETESTEAEVIPANAAAEPSIEELQKMVKDAEKVGYLGRAADPTPNEHYTVAGVVDPDRHVPEEYKVRTGEIVYPEDVVAQNSDK